MIKRSYLAIVNNDFDPENFEFKSSLENLEMSMDKHFPVLGIIKLSSIKEANLDLNINDLPFVEHIEIEEEVQIPPGEIDDSL